jgi:hypothetical protein
MRAAFGIIKHGFCAVIKGEADNRSVDRERSGKQ